MTDAPRRLKDDPDFRWETGCDLADEGFALGGYDLLAVRARVLAATLPPSQGAPLAKATTPRWRAWLGGAGAVALVAGVAALSLGTPRGEAPVPAPAEAAHAPAEPPVAEVPVAPVPAMEDPAQGEVPLVVAPVPMATSPEAPVAEARVAAAAKPARAEAPAAPEVGPEAPADAPTAATDVGAAPAAGSADAPAGEAAGGGSRLAAELSAYDRAADASSDGRFSDAVDAYRAYLDAWPDGRLRLESQVGLLFALVEIGDRAGAERLAAGLVERDDLGARRDDILRVRAQNLVELDRCDDALSIAKILSARAAADVRRACRWQGTP